MNPSDPAAAAAFAVETFDTIESRAPADTALEAAVASLQVVAPDVITHRNPALDPFTFTSNERSDVVPGAAVTIA